MSAHTLALIVLALMLVNEGIGLGRYPQPYKSDVKDLVSYPMTVCVWVLLYLILT